MPGISEVVRNIMDPIEGTKTITEKTIEGTKIVTKKTIEGTKAVTEKTIEGSKTVTEKTWGGFKRIHIPNPFIKNILDAQLKIR